MKQRRWVIGMIISMAMLQVGSVFAAHDDVVVKADTKDNFTTIVAAIHQQMAAGGRWEFVGKNERDTIDARFAHMQALFDKSGSVDKMDPNDKIQLFNDQEAINAILTKNDGNRKICETMAPTGSNIPITTCRTYDQVERERAEAQRSMQDLATPQLYGGH